MSTQYSFDHSIKFPPHLVNLVNKDQLDILATLRDSVNEDKVGLEADLERLKNQNKELGDKNRMQLEQVNALLLEKVNLQSEGIGQREKMLQRERAIGYVNQATPQDPRADEITAIYVHQYRARMSQRTSSRVCSLYTKRM